MSTAKNEPGLPSRVLPEWLELVWRQVESLRYGTVQIGVDDSRVILIEKNERVRLDKPQSETNQPTKTN